MQHPITFCKMKFPTKIGARRLITVPKRIMERMNLKEGDDVDVDIQLVPKTDKEKFDSHFRKGD